MNRLDSQPVSRGRRVGSPREVAGVPLADRRSDGARVSQGAGVAVVLAAGEARCIGSPVARIERRRRREAEWNGAPAGGGA